MTNAGRMELLRSTGKTRHLRQTATAATPTERDLDEKTSDLQEADLLRSWCLGDRP
jgi:hypothetical protein